MSNDIRKMMNLVEGKIDKEEFEEWLSGASYNLPGPESRKFDRAVGEFGFDPDDQIDLRNLSNSEIQQLAKIMKKFGWQ